MNYSDFGVHFYLQWSIILFTSNSTCILPFKRLWKYYLHRRKDFVCDELCLFLPGNGGEETPEKCDLIQHKHNLQGVHQEELYCDWFLKDTKE